MLGTFGLTGVNETALTYDMQRAHSADLWFIRMRAWFWGISISVGMLLIGNIAGSFGIDFFKIIWHLLVKIW